MKTQHWLLEQIRDRIPKPPEKLASEWGRKFVRLPGSALSQSYDPDITPWNKLPLDCLFNGTTRSSTHVKPVQAGGSSSGEVALCYVIANSAGGDIQYNWEDNDKASDRWDKRIEKILKACPEVMKLWPQDRDKAKKGLVIFPHLNLTVQGVFTDKNLDSDSIRVQINEEIHNWDPGKLDLARTRLTAYWNSIQFNISNASKKGDQLHAALTQGTFRLWENPCPGCGQFHFMHAKRKKDEPGGLCYDSEGCKRPDGTYNYDKLKETIFYEFECGYRIPDSPAIRRKLSLGGRYSAPTNPDARIEHESFTLEAVAVDYIPWIDLIIEKHNALRALNYGDPEPWGKYLRRRECIFDDPSERPLVGRVVLNNSLKKDREGLKHRALRGAAIDRQQGSLAKGEFPHWWVVIRDFEIDAAGFIVKTQLVYEGKLLSDGDVVDVVRRHDVMPRCVVVDSGHDTTHVYRFCLEHGFNAIKGAEQAWFSHKGKARRIYSEERALHEMLQSPRTAENPLDEPMFWLYSKHGIRERLHFLRSAKGIEWVTPGDVSEDYKEHMESEELRERRHPRTNEILQEWVQVRDRNDLFVCECYLAMLADMAGLIGGGQCETKS